jgi:hypothetical protein
MQTVSWQTEHQQQWLVELSSRWLGHLLELFKCHLVDTQLVQSHLQEVFYVGATTFTVESLQLHFGQQLRVQQRHIL